MPLPSETISKEIDCGHVGKSNIILSSELETAGCEDQHGVVSLPEWYSCKASNGPKVELIPLDSNPSPLSEHDIRLLNQSHHSDPFSVLGLHAINNHLVVVRVWVKDTHEIEFSLQPNSQAILKNTSVSLTKSSDWLFEQAFEVKHLTDDVMTANSLLSEVEMLYNLRVRYQPEGEWHIRQDAYSFGICLSDYDLKNFNSGHCWHVDNLMGSHLLKFKHSDGCRFAVWAPSAQFVSVVGDWNQWDGRAHPMRKRHDYGVWELFIPNVPAGEKYGYKLHTAQGTDIVKIDPFAQEFENPPAYSSIISKYDDPYKPSSERFQWSDNAWMEQREQKGLAEGYENIQRQPMSIYEVHLPSWRRGEDNSYLTFRELADPLVKHVKDLGFTHLEFLPLAHHPFEGSWGYQVSGNYAPYSRLGSADDLKFLINRCHEEGIGVFVDFVPAHFVKDDWALARFDGQPLYEYSDPKEGEHFGWGTYVYNFGRSEVRSYLLGAAYHWIRRFHIDGLRIDAVSAMIYKNYCREDGEWIPNEHGGDANLQAITLLQEMNWVVHKNHPGVFMMAEESTSWRGVTDKKDGLGFDAKWDLGWMNDTLAYTCTPGHLKQNKNTKLTFRGLYVDHENWICPLSHDEVVSGKGSLLDKMGFEGTNFKDKLQTLKAVLAYQFCLPGKPLLFMGGEFGQGREWNEKHSLDWHEAEENDRAKCLTWVKDLLHTYKTERALHAGDSESWNFKWSIADAASDNLIAFIRSWGEWYEDVLVIINFSNQKYHRYPIGVPHGGAWSVLLNSDDWKYAGAMHGRGNGDCQYTTQGGVLGWPYCLWLDVPAASAMILKSPQPAKPAIIAPATTSNATDATTTTTTTTTTSTSNAALDASVVSSPKAVDKSL